MHSRNAPRTLASSINELIFAENAVNLVNFPAILIQVKNIFITLCTLFKQTARRN